jgi:two-component system sensor histidine kinase CpxA
VHRLFWKIFISFWISLILFAGASLLVASMFIEHARTDDSYQSPRDRMRLYSDQARAIAARGGVDGLTEWLKEIDRREVIPLLLLDSQGKDLLDRTVAAYLSERHKHRGAAPGPHGRPGPPPRHGLIRTPDGKVYRLVPDFRAVTLSRALSRPRIIAIPLIAAAVISGLVCFFLARYLTRPLRRLSQAAKTIASGDLNTRVAPTMGGRRDEVAELAKDFDAMAERLQALIGAQRQLLSDVSHELRSPLARLQVALGLVRQRSPDRSNPELDRIEREADRLNELIAQLLSLSRLEAGTGLIDAEEIDLAGLLTEIVESADFEAKARNRRVRLHVRMQAVVEGDPRLLRSAVENVVRNAARHTNENTTVEVSLQPDEQYPGNAAVWVDDSGPGVPEKRLDSLFEPFVRVEDARDRASGGYGLGLAIAKRAIRLHKGAIWATNRKEGGLTVGLRLPTSGAQSLTTTPSSAAKTA